MWCALRVDDTKGRDDIPDRGSEKRVEIQLRLQEGYVGSHATRVGDGGGQGPGPPNVA